MSLALLFEHVRHASAICGKYMLAANFECYRPRGRAARSDREEAAMFSEANIVELLPTARKVENGGDGPARAVKPTAVEVEAGPSSSSRHLVLVKTQTGTV